jgi:hypothetical protein
LVKYSPYQIIYMIKYVMCWCELHFTLLYIYGCVCVCVWNMWTVLKRNWHTNNIMKCCSVCAAKEVVEEADHNYATIQCLKIYRQWFKLVVARCPVYLESGIQLLCTVHVFSASMKKCMM